MAKAKATPVAEICAALEPVQTELYAGGYDEDRYEELADAESRLYRRLCRVRCRNATDIQKKASHAAWIAKEEAEEGEWLDGRLLRLLSSIKADAASLAGAGVEAAA